MQPTDFAESTMNSVTSSAAAAVTTNTFLPPVAAVTSSITLASRWALCKPLDQSIRAAHCTTMARGMTNPPRPIPASSKLSRRWTATTRMTPPKRRPRRGACARPIREATVSAAEVIDDHSACASACRHSEQSCA